MSVPFIDLKRFEPGFVEGFLKDVEQIVRNTQFVTGPQVVAFEKEIAEALEARHAVGCANGTDAIQIALRAAGVGRGDKVLLPDMTFWATFEAVVNVCATPVTVDVDFETLHLSHELFLEGLEKFKPKAALLVHLYGWAAPDTEKIRQTARERGVILIEDCAQALGTRLNGQSVVGSATIATTSFYPAKVLGASGDAGAVFAQDEQLAKRAARLVNHGRKSHYEHDLVGWNSRLGVYEAAFMRASLPHLKARIDSRVRACDIYRRELEGLPLRMKSPMKGVTENGYTSTGIIDEKLRPKLIDALKAEGIGYGTIYPGAMSAQEGAAGWSGGTISRGVAQRIALSVLNLPCFAYISDSEVSRVVDVVKKACRSL